MLNNSSTKNKLVASNILALFSPHTFENWLHFSKKLIDLFLINNHLKTFKPNYKATSLIFIMKPLAS